MKKYAILSLMAVLALGACSDDDEDTLGPSNSAEIRVVNASNGVPSVGLFRGSSQLLGGVGFQTASSCDNIKRVPAGQQTLEFRSTASASVTKSVPFNFVAGQRYLVVLYGPSNNLSAVVLPEQSTTTTAGTNMNRLRFINATTTAGDIYATTAAGTITGTPTVGNLSGGGSTSGTTMYQDIANTNVRFRLFNTSTTTGTPRGDYTINTTNSFPTSRNAAIVFTDAVTAGGATAFQINACS